MILCPCALAQQEARQGGTCSIGRDSVVAVVEVTNVVDGILQTFNNLLCHFLTRCARTVSFGTFLVDYVLYPRHIAKAVDKFHIPPRLEEVAYRAPMLGFRLLKHTVVKMREHDIDAAYIVKVPSVARCCLCHIAIGILVLAVVTACHESAEEVAVELRVDNAGIEVGADVSVSKHGVARIHERLEVVVLKECVDLGQVGLRRLLKKVVVAPRERECCGKSGRGEYLIIHCSGFYSCVIRM